MRYLNRVLRSWALRDRRYDRIYRRVARPGGRDWAELLRERGDFHSMGQDCVIDPGALIEMRSLISLGNNVRLNYCAIFPYDGAVNMLNRAYGLHLDSIGKVEIRDNVFVGYGAIILPGSVIGPNVIVSAGSLVHGTITEGDIVAGVPATRHGRVEMAVASLKAKNAKYPWRDLLATRRGEFDPTMEDELMRMRIEYFFGSGQGSGK